MAALSAEPPHYTYDNYAQWEGEWELIEGIPYAMAPAPNITHQEINAQIAHELLNQIDHCPHCRVLPEVDWKIAEETVVRPDLSVVCNLGHRGQFLTQKPTIIFEILSPSTKRKDRDLKYRLYQEAGVEYFILIEPAGMFAEVYRLERGVYRLQGEFKREVFRFEMENCAIDFSFERVFGAMGL